MHRSLAALIILINDVVQAMLFCTVLTGDGRIRTFYFGVVSGVLKSKSLCLSTNYGGALPDVQDTVECLVPHLCMY
jgi:hypothetical protein